MTPEITKELRDELRAIPADEFRDLCAISAMAGELSAQDRDSAIWMESDSDTLAQLSYARADSMLRAREKNHSHGAQAASPTADSPPLSPAAVAADTSRPKREGLLAEAYELTEKLRLVADGFQTCSEYSGRRIAELEEQLKFATGFRVKEQE
jgi:hypothetical protein